MVMEKNTQSCFVEALEAGDTDAWQAILKEKKENPLFRLDLGLCLLEAAKVGNDAAVISVLELSPSLRRTDAKRRQAIHYAAQNGLTQSVECLLRAGATVSCSDDCDWTPLHITCQHGYLEVARILLRQGANANSARTQDRITPLHIVSASGNLALVELLLNNRGNPNTKTSQEHGGFTALALAVKNGLLDVAIMLCEHGANIDEIDAEGRFLPHLALDSGQPAMLNFLCRQTYNLIDLKGRNLIHMAIDSGLIDVVALLYNDGADFDMVDEDGSYPLHRAILRDQLAVAKFLCENGININLPDGKGCFAVHLAIMTEQYELAELLLQNGAFVDVQDGHGNWSPLHLACMKGNTKLVNALIEHGANIEAKDKYCRSPLFVAIGKDRREIVSLLLKFQAEVNIFDDAGMTPVHTAAVLNLVPIMELLITAGADVNLKDPNNEQTALMMVSGLKATEALKCLLRHGADPNTGDKRHSYTPLHRAQMLNRPGPGLRATELLLKAGANLAMQDHQGYTPLERCIFTAVMRQQRRLPCIKLLVESGASLGPGPQTFGKSSPLFWLTFSGMLREAFYLANVGWPLKKEPWIALPGKTPQQDQLHAFFRLCYCNPASLRHLCRTTLRQQLAHVTGDTQIFPAIELLPLPTVFKSFLAFQDKDYSDSTDILGTVFSYSEED